MKAIKKAQVGGKFSNVHTGDNKTNPGIIKAKADKVKANSNLKAYKAKAKTTSDNAISVAKKKINSKK